MSATERLDRMEETLFFQERLLRELHEALAGQQSQLDAMQRTLSSVAGRVAELRLLVDAVTGPVNAPPPHYREG